MHHAPSVVSSQVSHCSASNSFHQNLTSRYFVIILVLQSFPRLKSMSCLPNNGLPSNRSSYLSFRARGEIGKVLCVVSDCGARAPDRVILFVIRIIPGVTRKAGVVFKSVLQVALFTNVVTKAPCPEHKRWEIDQWLVLPTRSPSVKLGIKQ